LEQPPFSTIYPNKFYPRMGEKKKESGQERSNPHRRDGGDGGSDGRKASGKGYLPQHTF